MVALVGNDAIEDLHLVLLRLFEQKHFGIQIARVADAELHVARGLNRPLAVIDDRCLAQMPQETIEALRAVAA